MKPISRRAVLRGASGAVVALPFLDCMQPAGAATMPAPKRVIFMYSSCGSVLSAWKPSTVGPNPAPSQILMPLAGPDLKPYLTVLSGLNHDANGGVDTHPAFMSTTLTGAKYSASSGYAGLSTGVSLDMALGEKLKDQTPFPSIQTAIATGGPANPGDLYLSYRAKAGGGVEPVAGQTDPGVLYTRLFSNLSVPAPKTGATTPPPVVVNPLAGKMGQDRSVLDFVGSEYKRLSAKLGTNDRNRLEEHAAAIRKIEGQLGAAPAPTGGGGAPGAVGQTPTAGCGKPTMGTNSSPASTRSMLTTATSFSDLIAASFACDLTRVATLQFGCSESGLNWDDLDKGLGITSEGTSWWHGISHQTSSTAPPATIKIQLWLAERLAYLCRKLKTYVDVDGKSVMDNTLIFWTTECAEGANHSSRNMPFTVMGNMGGSFKSNIHLAYNNRPHGDLLASIGTGMGLPGFATYGYMSKGVLSDWLT